MIVEKKSWPKLFKEIKTGKKKIDIRLADFKIKKGDILILKEWNQKNKTYTGKKIKIKVKNIIKIPRDARRFYSEKDIKRHGIYLIEL
jgi:ASC-1-like (ASCH) protein